jgi:hypothetical protein
VIALLIFIFNGVLYANTGLIDTEPSSLGFSSKTHLIGMMLLMALTPMWLLVCFGVTQRHSLAMAQRLDASLAQSILNFSRRHIVVGLGG